MVNDQLVEKSKAEQEEIRHSFEEKMRTLQEDKVHFYWLMIRL